MRDASPPAFFDMEVQRDVENWESIIKAEQKLLQSARDTNHHLKKKKSKPLELPKANIIPPLLMAITIT